MEIFELIKAAIYGLVEGISEWLPISSTGHLLLLEQLLPLSVSNDFWNMFLVVIQLGAILAVIVLFFGELNPFDASKSDSESKSTWLLWAKIIVACIPAAAVGIPLDDWMEEHLGSPFIIAAALIVYGIAFIVIENMRKNQTDEGVRIHSIDELDWPTAIGIGIFQVLSLVPGTSRSGSTIIGGLLLGCSRSVAASFTFFLAIPVMAGASGLRLVKYLLKGNTFASGELAILGVGCAVAFLVSLGAIRFLMAFVRKHDFKPFGIYRILLGLAVIVCFVSLG